MAHLTKSAHARRLGTATALPPHVHAVTSKGRVYYYFQLHRTSDFPGPRIKIANPWSPEEIAQAHALSYASEVGSAVDWPKQIQRAYRSAKGRARLDRLDFKIDERSLAVLLGQQNFRCAVSGIPFDAAPHGTSRLMPFSISIDRLDGRKGYTLDNIRLVACIANFAMGQWGLPALERLAEAISSRRRQRTAAEPQIVKHVKRSSKNP
jgi:hypothetical protein